MQWSDCGGGRVRRSAVWSFKVDAGRNLDADQLGAATSALRDPVQKAVEMLKLAE